MAIYRVRKDFVQVIGKGWYNQTMAMEYSMDRRDADATLRVPEAVRREAVEDWLATHSGDFQSITDFRPSLGAWEGEWGSEEGECAFNDCMYPAEE